MDQVEPTIDEVLVPGFDNDAINRLSDTGLAKAFALAYRSLIRFAVDESKWYCWDGTRWRVDSRDTVKVLGLTAKLIERRRQEFASIDDPDERENGFRELLKYESAGHRKSMVALAATEPVLQIDRRELDVDPYLLVCANGTVDLRTGDIRPSRSIDHNSLRSPINYDPKATSPLLDLFLKTFIPEPEDQRYIFAVLGHALIGGNTRRSLILMPGATTSGKSQLMQMIHLILDDYACTINSSVFRANLDDKPRPDLVFAMFKRLAYASEASKSWTLHADQIKRLTGGDSLPYRDLYAGMTNETPRFTPMIVTNVMPRVSGMDTATARRVVVLPMDRSLAQAEEDPEVKRAFLADERTRQAVLALLVKGARDDFIETPPEKFITARMRMAGEMSHLDEFKTWVMLDHMYVVPATDDMPTSSRVKLSTVYTLYRHWLSKYGDADDKKDLMNIRAFNSSVQETLGWTRVKSGEWRWADVRLGESLPIEIQALIGL